MKLRTGYLLMGCVTGLILLFSFICTLPDGKLHITYCDVGQGDAVYIRFPDGRDMLVDGGPDGKKLLSCLGRHMPFWDRSIDMVLLSHPQNDHLKGLVDIVEKYSVKTFLQSDIANLTQTYITLIAALRDHHVPIRYVTDRSRIEIGQVRLSFLWPSDTQIAKGVRASTIAMETLNSDVLGIQAKEMEYNDFCAVFSLSYGTFDALFPGDADSHVQNAFIESSLGGDPVEILKVPHHGSKTGITLGFLDWLQPLNSCEPQIYPTRRPLAWLNNERTDINSKKYCPLAVISVGKNSYGHPAQEVMNMLEKSRFTVERTDRNGDIEIESDGKNWNIIRRKTDDDRKSSND